MTGLQLSRAVQGTDSLEFLPVVAKAAIADLREGGEHGTD